jgi:heterodisulfide reductase subunit C
MNPAELIVALRHIVVRELGPPPFVVATAQNVANLGQSVEVSGKIIEVRSEMELPAEPFDRRYREKAVLDIRTIMKTTGFDKLVGMNLED